MSRTEELEQEIARLRERLSRLSEASLHINESLDFAAVLQGVVDSACSLTGAQYAGLSTVDGSGERQEFFTAGLSSEERQWMLDVPEVRSSSSMFCR